MTEKAAASLRRDEARRLQGRHNGTVTREVEDIPSHRDRGCTLPSHDGIVLSGPLVRQCLGCIASK